MIYSKNELNAISNAMLETSNYTDTALYMLNDFREKYLETAEGVESLIFTLQHDYDRVNFELFAISQILLLAKNDLDLYVGNDSYSLNRYFENAKERSEIYKIIHNKAV